MLHEINLLNHIISDRYFEINNFECNLFQLVNWCARVGNAQVLERLQRGPFSLLTTTEYLLNSCDVVSFTRIYTSKYVGGKGSISRSVPALSVVHG